MTEILISEQEKLLADNEDLQARLDEAVETLRAIRSSEVDAIIVPGVGGEQVYSLKGADHFYRVLIEQMGEGALLLSMDGIILYCNQRFSEIIAIPIEQIIGNNIGTFVNPSDRAALDAALESKTFERLEIECKLTKGASTLVRLTLVFLLLEKPPVICLTIADLTDARHREMELEQARENLEKRVTERTLELQLKIAEGKQLETKLKELSFLDSMTGLYNRGFFDEEMARFGRGRQFPISIIMADINKLKETNDRDGHTAGDALLQRTAQVLKTALRGEDIIARIGGDEFAVILPATDTNAARKTILRIQQTLDNHNNEHAGTPLSIAFGVSTTKQGGSLWDTFKDADAKMYEDKRVR